MTTRPPNVKSRLRFDTLELADCDQCPLGGLSNNPNWRSEIVPSEEWPTAVADVLFDRPGDEEVKQRRPNRGPEGVQLSGMLKQAGYSFQHINHRNPLACQPPKIALQVGGKTEYKVQNPDQYEKTLGEGVKTPTECCRPRLEAELAGSPLPLIATGKRAVRWLGLKVGSLSRAEGRQDWTWNGKTVGVSALHASIRHAPGKRHLWVSAIQSHLDAFTNKLNAWRKPEIVIGTTSTHLEKFAAKIKQRRIRILDCDIESDSLYVNKAEPDMIQFAYMDTVGTCRVYIQIFKNTCDAELKHWFTREDWKNLLAYGVRILSNPRRRFERSKRLCHTLIKLMSSVIIRGHNFIRYDSAVIASWLFRSIGPLRCSSQQYQQWRNQMIARVGGAAEWSLPERISSFPCKHAQYTFAHPNWLFWPKVHDTLLDFRQDDPNIPHDLDTFGRVHTNGRKGNISNEALADRAIYGAGDVQLTAVGGEAVRKSCISKGLYWRPVKGHNKAVDPRSVWPEACRLAKLTDREARCSPVDFDHLRQEQLTQNSNRRGFLVSEKRRLAHEKALTWILRLREGQLMQLLYDCRLLSTVGYTDGKPNFNVKSHPQMTKLLWTDLAIKPPTDRHELGRKAYTDTGSLSCSMDIITCLMARPVPGKETKKQRNKRVRNQKILKALWLNMKVRQYRSTFILPYRPYGTFYDTYPMPRKWNGEKQRWDEPQRMRCWPNEGDDISFILSSFSIAGTNCTRIISANPNMANHPKYVQGCGYGFHSALSQGMPLRQAMEEYNFPGTYEQAQEWQKSAIESGPHAPGLRDIFVASKDGTLIFTDMDMEGAHLTSVAGFGWSRRLHRCKREGLDGHSSLGDISLGHAYHSLPGHPTGKSWLRHKPSKKTPAGQVRDLILKPGQFAGIYGASAETMHQTLIGAIDDFGNPLMVTMNPRQGAIPINQLPIKFTRGFRTRWHQREPELPEGWDRFIHEYHTKGYLRCELSGAREDFTNFVEGDSVNDIINWRFLRAEQFVCGWIWFLLHRIMPPGFQGPRTGQVFDLYDGGTECIRVDRLQETLQMKQRLFGNFIVPYKRHNVQQRAEQEYGPDLQNMKGYQP